MELYQIRYFLAAAETLNFTRAAERCHVTQPTLTRAIQRLEQDLGGPLFHRERSHMQLTELGREMRKRLAAIRHEAEEAGRAARRLLNLEKSTLNLGIMCTIGPQRAMGFLAEFQMDNPGVEINLHETTPATMTEGLLDGRLDLSLVGLPTALHERFDRLLLYRERMTVVFAPGHRFGRLGRVPLGEFAGEPYLDRLNCEFREAWFELLAERDIALEVPYRSAREDWIQSMVAAGLGVSLMPELAVNLAGLEQRPICDPEIERSVELVTVGGRRHSPALKAFLDAARAYAWLR